MKKGMIVGGMVDFFAFLTFILFAVIMVFLFQLKGASTSVQISQSMESIGGHIVLNAILETPADGKTIGELYGDYLDDPNEEKRNFLISKISKIFENTNYSYAYIRGEHLNNERYLEIKPDSADWGKGYLNLFGAPETVCEKSKVSIVLPTRNHEQMEVTLAKCE